MYSVSTGGLSDVKVAVLDGQVRGVSKTTGYSIIITKNCFKREYEANQIISETDEFIIIKKIQYCPIFIVKI